MNMTPLRLRVLRFLADKPGGFNVSRLVDECCPRERGCRWTAQGAARMSGKLCNPLHDAGLIRWDDWRQPPCARGAILTDAGRALLAQHDKAASDAARDAAIASGA